MYAGHLAAGLAIKARVPDASTWAVLTGVAFLDLLFPPLVLMGIERISPVKGFQPGFNLDFIDWSHSLVMALIWSVLYAVLFLKHGRSVMLALAAAVFSHFVLDWLMHPGDLALYPYSATHLGIGLWRLLPVGWWFFELGFVALCCLYYLARAKRLRTFGGRAAWACSVVLVLHLINSPWLSPVS